MDPVLKKLYEYIDSKTLVALSHWDITIRRRYPNILFALNNWPRLDVPITRVVQPIATPTQPRLNKPTEYVIKHKRSTITMKYVRIMSITRKGGWSYKIKLPSGRSVCMWCKGVFFGDDEQAAIAAAIDHADKLFR